MERLMPPQAVLVSDSPQFKDMVWKFHVKYAEFVDQFPLILHSFTKKTEKVCKFLKTDDNYCSIHEENEKLLRYTVK
jgi:hypothetical protein